MGDIAQRILVIEDDEFLLQVYMDRLKDEGFEVHVATKGTEGIQKAIAEKPAVILLDMILPQMSGFDVLRQLKREDSVKDIPVIVLSNLSQDDDVQTATQLGASAYMVKSDTSFRLVLEEIQKNLPK